MDLIPALAALDPKWSDPGATSTEMTTIPAWGIAAIARESLLYGNDYRPELSISLQEIVDLNFYFQNAYTRREERIVGDLGILGIQVRHFYEQFPFQESDFEEISRTIALLRDAVAETHDERITANHIESLIGSSLEEWVSAGVALFAIGHGTSGEWLPSLYEHEELAELFSLVPRDVVERTQLSITANQELFKANDKAAYTKEVRPPHFLQRWAYNPLAAFPLVKNRDSRVFAPQPRLVLRRLTPNNFYYSGLAAFGKSFVDALGPVVQHYVGNQLGLVEGASVIPEIVWGREEKRSVDWFLILPNCLVLVEVKSMRLTLGTKAGDIDLIEKLSVSLDIARKQINRTVTLLREKKNPAFEHIPQDLPIIALIVTAEPIYVGNSQHLEPHLEVVEVPTLVCSLRDLEHLVPRTSLEVEESLNRIVHDPELRHWILGTALKQVHEDRKNPILEKAADSLPVFQWIRRNDTNLDNST
jgi:hypothetical protein